MNKNHDIFEFESNLIVDSIKKIDSINNYAYSIYRTDPDYAWELLEKTKKLSRKNAYMAGHAEALTNIGIIKSERGDYEDALKDLHYAIEIFTINNQYDHRLFRAYNSTAIVKIQSGDYSEGAKAVNSAILIAKDLGDKDLEYRALSNLSMLKNYQGEREEALELLFQVKELAQSKTQEISALFNIGAYFMDMKDYEKAEKNLNLARDMASEEGMARVAAAAGGYLGNIYSIRENPDRAIETIKNAIQLSIESNDRLFTAQLHTKLARIYLNQGEIEFTIKEIEDSLRIAGKLNSINILSENYKILSNAYKSRGDYKESLENFEKYHDYDKQLQNKEARETTKSIEADIFREKAELFEGISKFGRNLTSNLKIEKVLKNAYEFIRKIINPSVFSLASCENGNLKYLINVIDDREIDPSKSLSGNINILTANCVLSGRPIIIKDIEKDYIKYTDDLDIIKIFSDETKYKSMLFFPLIYKENTVGVLSVQCYKKNAFTLENQTSLEILASYMAIALENIRNIKLLEKRNWELEQLSQIDQLSGLMNRRAFNERFKNLWNWSHRNKIGLAVLMVDADKFKIINDTYGHLTGDNVIKEIARILKTTIQRTTDIVARYGGEEFAVVLSDLNLDSAKHIAERIREIIENCEIPSEGIKLSVTVSIGICFEIPLAADNQSMLQMIQKADKALYKAKDSGRNRVCSY